MTYPEIEGVRDILHAAKWSDVDVDVKSAEPLLKDAVLFALKSRKTAHEHYCGKASFLEEDGSEESLTEARRFRFLAYHRSEKNIFQEIFKFDLNRFEADGTLGTLFELYKNVVADLGGPNFALISTDHARINQQIQEQE